MATTKPTVKRSKQHPKPRNAPRAAAPRVLGTYEQGAKKGADLYIAASLVSARVLDTAVDYVNECNRPRGTPASEAKARLQLMAAVEKLEKFSMFSKAR